MSIDPLIRQFQVPPADTRRRDPKRDLPVAPVGGRVFLTREVEHSAEQGNVVGTGPRSITPYGPNQWNGNQQVGMETTGGCSTLKLSVPDDPDYGLVDVQARSGWRIVLNGPQLIRFTIGEADELTGVTSRRNAFVAREWWVHVCVVLNGFKPTWQEGIYWPDGQPPEIDVTMPRWRGTFVVEQLGVGQPLEVTLWSGGGFAKQAVAP